MMGSKKTNCKIIFVPLVIFVFIIPLIKINAQTGFRLFNEDTPLSPLLPGKAVYSLSLPLSLRPVEYPSLFKRDVSIDSTGKYITITFRFDDRDVYIPQRLKLEDYIKQRIALETVRKWKLFASHKYLAVKDKSKQGGITIESPRIKSRTFRRLFGGETLSLNVTGNITIDGSLRHEKRDQVMTATSRAPMTNFRMKQTQRFKVEGKIGENVSILVDQDSERAFEFENALKIRYTGDEDAILQSIDAGNVSLSLPGTKFVTFSASNSGLFGIKSTFKIGKLDITAIASMEKGKKEKLTITGGKEEGSFSVQDYNYKRFTYFFLHQRYRDQYPKVDADGIHIYIAENEVTRIDVYKCGRNYQSIHEDAIKSWAVVDPLNPDTSKKTNDSYQGFFLRLEPNKDYIVDKKLGYIRMERSLMNDEVLAVAYRDTTGKEFGSLPDQNGIFPDQRIFKIIKPTNPTPDLQTWSLEWKNVYSLGGTELSENDLDIKIYYKPPSGDPLDSTVPEGQSNAKGYLEIFGLDKLNEMGGATPDGNIDFGNANIIDLNRGEIIFPDLTPFYPEAPDSLPQSGLPKDQWANFYNVDPTNQSNIITNSNFYIEVKSSSISRLKSTYQLGMNVIENSEKVTLSGRQLDRGIDYNIDYRSGLLTLTTEAATDANADLDVTYESQEMFSIDRKMLLGTRAEYTLWEKDNQRAFIGATLLYRSLKTLDRRINVNKESPYSNLVWDINTSLNMKPKFLTDVFNMVPLLDVSGESKVSFEGEIAQVIPNPNSLNNKKTGDPDGVAYVDDFEGAKLQNKLTINKNAWKYCSQPIFKNGNTADISKRGYFSWVNPYNKVNIQDIWPNRETSRNMGNSSTTDILDIRLSLPDTLQTEEEKRQIWGGMQMALPSGYANQTKSRFLEVWIKGEMGRIHVDLGRISEDIIPNKILDTEDKLRGGMRDDILQEDEDTGIDGVKGADPPYNFYPHEPASITDGNALPYDFWDLDGNGLKDALEPWSYDDFSYKPGEEYSNFFMKNCGTENSRNSATLKIPDSEDLNRNSTLDLTNSFFSYKFSLENTSPDTSLIDGYGDNGWRKYQLSLNETDTVVGNPQWSRIEYIRIWVDSVNTNTDIQIVEVNIVGNEWRYKGIFSPGDTTNLGRSDDSTMTIKVYNTHENPDNYKPPSGVEGKWDPVHKIHHKEQALVLDLNDLPPHQTAIAQKTLYKPVNLIHYRRLKMYVHGGDIAYTSFPPDSSPVDFYLEIGSDTKNENYYQIKFSVYQGWDERNLIDVALETFSKLKLNREADQDTSSIIMENGHTITIVGEPSLTNVRWLRAGLTNTTNTYFSGEVWLNEFRVSNVRKEKGMAMRARASVDIGDFLNFNGEYNRKDADFHTVNERFGKGSNSESYSFNASIKIDKFLPASWGLSIPVRGSLSKSLSTPKYMPGSDIIVNKNTITSAEEMRKIQTENTRKGFSVALSKRKNSRSFIGKYFLDPVQTNVSYNRTDMHSSQILFSRSISYKGKFSYNLSLNKKYHFMPFKWLGEKGIFKKIAGTKIYYPFSNLNWSIDANDTRQNSENRSGVPKSSIQAQLNSSSSISLKPMTDFSIDYSSSQCFNMLEKDWFKILSEPPEMLNFNQTVRTNITPDLFSWFSPSFKYNASYKWANKIQMQNSGASKSAGVTSDFTISGKFSPDKLIDSFSSKKTTKKKIRRPRTRNRQTKEEKSDDEKKKENTDKDSFTILSIFSSIGNLLKKIEPIRVDFSKKKSRNDNGILSSPSLAYQLGFSDNDLEYSDKISQPRSEKNTSRISFRSGLSFSNKFKVSLDYDFSATKNISSQTTETISRSIVYFKEKAIPFPSWTVRCNGLEQISFLSSVFKSFTVNHSFNGKMTEQKSENKTTGTTYTSGFSPLVGISMSFKNNITANIQYTSSMSVQEQTQYSSSKNKSVSSNLSMSGQYSLKKGIKLPFFKKRLDNTIDMSLTFDMGNKATYQKRGVDAKLTLQNFTKNWSFKPRISYTFSRTVTGSIHLELGNREDKRIGSRTITAFGINANIKIG